MPPRPDAHSDTAEPEAGLSRSRQVQRWNPATEWVISRVADPDSLTRDVAPRVPGANGRPQAWR
jgi:hypothetical protein